MKELLALPWQVQIVIVGGYLAYVVAYTGKRSAHKAVDTVSIILCFGGISILTFEALDEFVPEIINLFGQDLTLLREFCLAVCSMMSAVGFAILWRRYLGNSVRNILGRLSKNDDDGLPTGWDTIIQTPNFDYSQLNVTLKNGNKLECDAMGNFNDLPNGPCILGGDGSIAMYVTHIEDAKGIHREANNLVSKERGARMTFIPADQIAEVDIRRM